MADLKIVGVFLLFAFVSGKFVHEMQIDKKYGFKWNNCATKDTPVMVIKKFSISPDPFIIGKPLQASFALDVLEDIGANPKTPVNVDSKVELEVSGKWMDLCAYAKQYCELKDVCSRISPKMCTILEKLKIPCKCPLPKATYSKDDIEIPFNLGIAVTGKINATFQITEGTRQIGCFNVGFCIQSCDG